LAYAKDAQISKLLQGAAFVIGFIASFKNDQTIQSRWVVRSLLWQNKKDAMLVEGRQSRARSVASAISREELATSSQSDDEARSAPSRPLSSRLRFFLWSSSSSSLFLA
jgi:hypothetical protein